MTETLGPRVMGTTRTGPPDQPGTDEPDVPRLTPIVDWIAAALIALGGVALALAGGLLLVVLDGGQVAGAVAEGVRDTAQLSEAAVLEVALTTGTWTGWGLVVTGLGLFAGSVAYVLHRRAINRRVDQGGPAEDFLGNAVVGAVVAAVLAFLPVSPAMGGGVAGYFERRESDRVLGVGALSGLLAAAPPVAIMGFALAGMTVGLVAVNQDVLATVVVAAALFSIGLIGFLAAALGALGGYVGGRLAASTVDAG